VSDDRAEMIEMIRESAAAVSTPTDLARVRSLRFGLPGFAPAVLEEMGGLGWIGLRIPDVLGGVGLGMAEAIALHEELGRGLVPEPLIVASLSAALLAACGAAEAERAIAGTALYLTAWQSEAGSLSLGPGEATERLFLPMAAGAEAFLVPVPDGDSLQLHLLRVKDAQLRTQTTQDGGNFGTITISAATPLGLIDQFQLTSLLDEAALLSAAQLLGMSEQVFALTLAYLKEREQFGHPLASFQALQHRCADIKIQLALTRASIEGAANEIDAGAQDRRRQFVVSRAKCRAAATAQLLARETVQLHGAIGYTDEYDAGLFVRKILSTVNQFGSIGAHRDRFMQTLGA